jgi:hypothetical protein
MADVGGKEDTCDVGRVRDKLADGQDRGGVATLNHAPNINVALICCVSELW